MRHDTITLYTFDELSESAKSAALDHCREWQACHEWWDGVYMDAERVGLDLTSFDLDRRLHACGEFSDSAEACARSIIREHGPDCDTYKDAEAYLSDLAKLADDDDDAREDLDRGFLKTILEDYAWILQHEYEWLTSDEEVAESIRANGYEFYEDGNIA